MITPDDLRAVPAFADLAENELQWLAERSRELRPAEGEVVAAEGERPMELYVLLEGELQFRQEGEANGRIFIMGPGELTGALPFSRMVTYPGTMRAATDARVAAIHRDHFAEMMHGIPVLEQRFVSLLADRVRETTRAEQQREKLMALGKLSAGLAHEMNNPAAAVRRAAAGLRERLHGMPELTANLAGCGLDAAQFAAIAGLQNRCTLAHRARLSPLEASEREEETGEWLQAHGVREPWVLAATFVTSGVQVFELDALAAVVPAHALPDAVAWLGSGLTADLLLREMEDAARRISELVASVKSYSRMDEAGARSEVDVHEGLESTLTMLTPLLRDRGVRVERDFDAHLPRPWASAGELNQVWTNLIDNAVDAVGRDGGRVLLRTFRRGGEVVVEVHDNGPGIPDAVADRIWEPFFTTKDVGEGTGLGLDIVRRIIVRQHGGQVSMRSQPGDTCFQVRLPISPVARRAAAAEPASSDAAPSPEAAELIPRAEGEDAAVSASAEGAVAVAPARAGADVASGAVPA